MKKLTALVSAGVGYVLGSRAGRQRYEQIRSAALRVKQNPKVQQATETAKGKAPVVKDKLSSAADAAKSKVSSDDSSSTSPSTSPTASTAPTVTPVSGVDTAPSTTTTSQFPPA